MCCYFLDNDGVPAAWCLACYSALILVLGIVTATINDCETINLHALTFSDWIITQGAIVFVPACLFLINVRWQLLSPGALRCMSCIKTAFAIAWGVTGIVLLATQEDSMQCGVPRIFVMLGVFPFSLIDFLFFAMLICFPTMPNNEYLRQFNTDP
jgi:hypothetical protein